MATNYTCELYYLYDRAFYVLKTKASNIQLVNLYNEYGEAKYIRNTKYYGMNASFFGKSNNYLLNIAYQDGKCIGTNNSANNNGYKNECGTGLITWNGSKLKYYENVENGSNSYVPKTSGSWAQGGYNLFLCDKDWESKFFAQKDTDDLATGSARTGILINESTGYVYLFATKIMTSKVYDIRLAMMNYAGLSQGGSPGSWRAILTDGGISTQLYCADVDLQTIASRKVPQIIALKNKT